MEKKLYSIYGAKKSKKGDRVNVELIAGENVTREFATISLKLEKVELHDGFVIIKVPLLKN